MWDSFTLNNPEWSILEKKMNVLPFHFTDRIIVGYK